jgi:predicted nuclease of restriction endonuclease-like RecB superfamily
MLTTDLLRVRDDGKLIAPRYLKLEGKRLEGYLERAEALIALFHRHEHLPASRSTRPSRTSSGTAPTCS